MKRIVVVALAALHLGCAPSRPAMLSPVQEAVRQRLGRSVQWRDETQEGAAVDDAVRQLLARELSEDGAVQVALLRNRGLVAGYEALGVSQATLIQAGLLANPVFGVGLSFSADGSSPDFDIGVEQDFLSLVFLPARIAGAQAEVEAAQRRTTLQVINVAAQARRAFVDVVAARQLFELRSSVAEAEEAAWDLARRQHDAGNISDLAWVTQKARYQEALLALAAAEQDERVTRERLNAAAGLFGNETNWKAPARLAEGALAAAAAEDQRAHLESKAVSASLRLSSMRADMDALAQRLGYQSARRFLPDLDVGVAVGRDDGTLEAGPRATIAFPVFDLGQGELLAAESRLRQRGAEYAAVASELRSRSRELLVRAQNASDREHFVQDELRPTRAAVVEEAQKSYNGMLIGVFALLDARKSQIEADVVHVQALRISHLLRIEFDTLLAGGDSRVPLEVEGAMPSSDEGEHP